MAAARRLLLILVAAAAAIGAEELTSPDDNTMMELKSGLILRPNSSADGLFSGTHPCSWTSTVTCNKDDEGTLRVTRVRMPFQATGGKLPADLGNLTKLDIFDATNNHLTGAIPKFADSLSFLDLSYNSFTSISPERLFHSMPNLVNVDLEQNPQLPSWEIPRSLTGCSKLGDFSAANSNLGGNIPPDFFSHDNFPILSGLHFSDNHLSGDISVLHNFTGSLEELSLGGNNLSGEIPDLSRLQNLRHLDVSNNQLTGGIPPSLEALTSLNHLNLSKNQLSGSIPRNLTGLTELWTLDLSNNRLNGSIPQYLADSTTLQILDLSNNNLSGVIPPFDYARVRVTTCGNPFLLSENYGKSSCD